MMEWQERTSDDAAPPQLPTSVQQLQQQGDKFAQTQALCQGWASKRPEELTPGNFIELTRLIYGSSSSSNEEDPSSSS